MSEDDNYFYRSNNPVLLRFLQTLSSATTDVLVQELVITVLCCCHDVVRPFLSSLMATYEPRLSMHWIANMNLLTKVRNSPTDDQYKNHVYLHL